MPFFVVVVADAVIIVVAVVVIIVVVAPDVVFSVAIKTMSRISFSSELLSHRNETEFVGTKSFDKICRNNKSVFT